MMEAFQLLFQESLCSSVVECPTSDTKVTGLNPVLGEYFFQGFCQKKLYLFSTSVFVPGKLSFTAAKI